MLKNKNTPKTMWLKQLLCIIRRVYHPFKEDIKNDDKKLNITKYIMLMQYTRYLSEKAEIELQIQGREVANGLLAAHLYGLPAVNDGNKGTDGIAIGIDVFAALRIVIEEEIMFYKEDININPDDAEVHYKLGFYYLLLKNNRFALKEYKILKNLFPSMADALLRKWNIKTPF